jgi:uncharacterized protein (DUF2141 family)
MRIATMVTFFLIYSAVGLLALEVSGFIATDVQGKVYLALNANRYVPEGEDPDYGFQGIIGAQEAQAGGIAFSFQGVEAGEYIIQGFVDTNDNGELDIGLFGPTEPYFFHRPGPVFFGPPDLKEVLFSVTEDVTDILIEPLGG